MKTAHFRVRLFFVLMKEHERARNHFTCRRRIQLDRVLLQTIVFNANGKVEFEKTGLVTNQRENELIGSIKD